MQILGWLWQKLIAPLIYLLFSQKLSLSVSYKVVSHIQDPIAPKMDNHRFVLKEF